MQKTDFADGFASLPKGAERQDALTGQRPHPAAVASLRLDAPEEPVEIDLANFIRYRGVAVLFAPGVRSLRVLAGA
jgi:hypothetical protein